MLLAQEPEEDRNAVLEARRDGDLSSLTALEALRDGYSFLRRLVQPPPRSPRSARPVSRPRERTKGRRRDSLPRSTIVRVPDGAGRIKKPGPTSRWAKRALLTGMGLVGVRIAAGLYDVYHYESEYA